MNGATGFAGLCGIGDEAAADLPGQLTAVTRLGWTGLELRTVDAVPLADLDEPAFARVRDAVAAAGLAVPVVDSRIAGWGRPITGDLADDLDELAVLGRRCPELGTEHIRIMSYPNGGLADRDWRAASVARIRLLVERARDLGLTLLHENCAGWAGASPSHSLELLAEVDSPALGLLFDTGNGAAYGYRAGDFLREVVEHVRHVHIKDVDDTADGPVYRLPGEGGARVAECLGLLAGHGYHGWLSLEPHLSAVPHQAIGPDGARSARSFHAAGLALGRLLSGPGGAAPAGLAPGDCALLTALLAEPTVSPLESGPGDAPHRLREAGLLYAAAAAELGFTVVQHAPAPRALLDGPEVPKPVREAARADPEFLEAQPNLLLRLGPPRPRARTLMFNVHLDTVAEVEPIGFDGTVFTGRGATDAKGAAVALLAGLRGALAADPGLAERICVLIQAVGGEEGGALGSYGTRALIEAGGYGALNVFCEPTGLRYLSRATAAMTARLRVNGRDAVDDRPGEGHNATVLLGFLAQHLAATLPREADGTSVCVAGLRTGTRHNRVYGSGELLLNLAYRDRAGADRLERAVHAQTAAGLRRFAEIFGGAAEFARTARDAAGILELSWDKRGLPALDGVPGWAADLFARAGIARWPDDEPGFTCDAIWMAQVPGAAAVVLGPGDLAANRAHAAGEFARKDDLDAFAAQVIRIVAAFADFADPAFETATATAILGKPTV